MQDAISPQERLSRLSPNRWQYRLAMMFFAVAIILALTLECSANELIYKAVLCPTGNSVAMRHDKRDRDGIIIDSKWKRTCLAPITPSLQPNSVPRRYIVPRSLRS